MQNLELGDIHAQSIRRPVSGDFVGVAVGAVQRCGLDST
jgi:hypothetical protein